MGVFFEGPSSRLARYNCRDAQRPPSEEKPRGVARENRRADQEEVHAPQRTGQAGPPTRSRAHRGLLQEQSHGQELRPGTAKSYLEGGFRRTPARCDHRLIVLI